MEDIVDTFSVTEQAGSFGRCCKRCVHGLPFLHVELDPHLRLVKAALCRGQGRHRPKGDGTGFFFDKQGSITLFPYPVGFDVKSESCPYRRALPGHGAFKLIRAFLSGR